MKDTIIRDIKKPFEQHEEDYCNPVRVWDFYDNNIETKSNGNRSKTLLIKKYLDEMEPYLKDIINNLKKSDTRNIQLIIHCIKYARIRFLMIRFLSNSCIFYAVIAINLISSKGIDEERLMH